MPFELPPLPFKIEELAPHISKETLEYHYGKHHQAYVNKLNELIKDSDFANKSLEEIIQHASGPIFNNAAQVWNHTFYWNCIAPGGSKKPEGELLAQIEKDFGSYEDFEKRFKSMAASNFGSGWTWLVKSKEGKLEIVNTSNAQTPLTLRGQKPILTCDVWEHAYYIDYRNARPTYLDHYWQLVNWTFVEKNFQS